MSIRRYVGLCLGVLLLLASPSLAQTVSFVDANGSTVSTYLENTRVHVRVEDPAANTYSWSAETVFVYLSASLSGDSEGLTLTETGQDTGVFEGSMALDFEPSSPYQPGVLETSLQSGPPVVRDTLTAQYSSASDTAGLVAGRIELLDDLGRPAAGYTQGDLVRVRLEDHLRYNDPGARDSILVAVNVLAVSDEEFISLLETGNDTNIFEGSIPAALYATYDGDGVVGAPVGNQVHAQHSVGTVDEWLDVYAPLVGSRAEILDRAGNPADFVAESSTIRLRAVDRTIGSPTLADTVQAGVSSLLGADQETVTLTETGSETGVYEADLATRFNIVDPTVLGNGRLETGEDAGPPHSFDTITLSYNGLSGASSDTATTYGSETFFIDEWGNDAEIFATGATVFVRVIDYNYDQSAALDSISAAVSGLTRGDNEYVNLVETGSHTGVFEGSLPIQYQFYSVTSYDGWLQAEPGETIEARHTDALGSTASADRAVIRYSDLHFFDAQGRPTNVLVEGGLASIRLYNFGANYSTYSVDTTTVRVRSLLGGDMEFVTVTETGTNTGIFEGTIRLVFSIGASGGNGTLEVSNGGSPDYAQDTVTADQGDALSTATTVGARVWLIDRFGQEAESFAAGDLVGIRVEDHNADDPQARQTLQVVAITNPETGDVESVNALETGYATGIFEGTVPSWLLPYFTANDGYLQVQAGDRLEGRHVWMHSPRIAVDSAVFTGSSVLFVDGIGGGGQPVESYLEATTVYVRLVYAGGNVTPSADGVTVTVSTAISLDSETLILTETGGNTGVFTGSIPIGNPGFVTPTPGNNVLETGRRTGPTELDTLTVTHTWSGGSASDTAAMINSRTWFVDAAGNPTDEYARDTRAYIRVEDHILDSSPTSYDVAQVTLRSLSTGDQETFYLQETGMSTGVFAGSMELDAVINGTTYAYPGDGKLQSDAGEEIEVLHEEWGVVASSSDRARIEYASVEFVDEAGQATVELLEGGVARLRVFEPYNSYGSGSVGVYVQSRYGDDQEPVTLTETAYQSRVYEGTIQLRSVAPGGAVSSNGTLETSTSGSPEYRADEVTASYGGDQALALTVPSRVTFIDSFGRAASTFAVTERAGVRVEDHNLDNPTTRGTVTVNVTASSGDAESVVLTETGYDTNLFEGSVVLSAPPYGGLTVQAGDVIRAQHGNLTRPTPTTAETTVTGSRIQFEDETGQPADVYLEGSEVWVRVVDSAAAGSISVTATLRTALGPDVETIFLTETAPGVFLGSMALGTNPAVVNDNVLTTVQYQGPPHEFDTLQVRYNADLSVMDTAATVSSRTWFVDAAGNPADKYSRESRAYVRVEDHVASQPGVYDSVQVTLRSLTTGDQETLYIQETTRDGGIFAGSIELDAVINGTTYPNPGDGKLQAEAGEDIEVVHTDWAGYSSSSDRARITYASVVFVDEAGEVTVELLEGGVARLRVFEPYNSYGGGSVGVYVQSLYGDDEEPVTLTETAYQSRVYEGTIQLRSVAPGGAVSSNGTLETSTSGSPEYRADEVTASYGGDQAMALTVPSRVMFVDGFGQVVSSFGVGEAVGVRVLDNNLDDPVVRRSVLVNVRSLAGDSENVTLTETGYDTNVYEGSIATQGGTPASGNGALQVQAGDVIEAEHGNQTTPNPTVVQATVTGASVLFVDADGQPAETYFEASAAYVRVTDITATGSVTVTVQALLAGDSESVTLTQTGPSVFEGSLPLRLWPSVEPNSGFIETRQDAGPPHEYDTLRVIYLSSAGAVTDTAGTINSGTWFVDAAGNPTDGYARGSRAYVRVQDHTLDQPGIQNTAQVTLRSLTTGDLETLTLLEVSDGLFEGSLALETNVFGQTYPSHGDGKLQSVAAEEIEVVHDDMGFGTSSSDRATVLFASVEFVDPVGVVTAELLEGGVARLRVFDLDNNYNGGTVGVWVQSLYGDDEEPVTLTETAYQSHIYEGTVQLRSVAPGGGVSSNNLLETSTSGSPEYLADRISASYGGSEAVAFTVPSRAWFLDLQGQVVTEYAVGSAVRVRVEDHNAGSAGQVDSVMVNLATPGDSESVTLTETGAGTGIFEGSIASGSNATGVLAAAPGVTVTVTHGNVTTPSPTLAQAVFSGNFAPLAVDDSAETEEAPVTIPVLANDSDPDAEALQVTAVTQGANGTVVINAGQTVTYSPTAGFLGTDTFTYIASDPRGGQSRATVTVTVLSANEPPTPAADNVTTPEDQAISIAVLANDTDPDNDPLEVIGSGIPSNGTAERQPDGTILYTPENNWSGQVTFTYMVRDPEGLTAYATVTVTVTPVNDPPVANDDAAATPEDSPVTIAVLANDSDPDGDVLDVTYTTGVTHGSAVVNADNTVTFTPEPEYSGTVLFSYAYTDGTVTGYADVTVTITSVNDAPVAVDDSTEVAEDSSATVWVLTNDTDADNDTLDVTAVTQGANGAVVLNADDTVTYTPNADFHGSDSFTYTVSDGNGGTDTATVAVTVVSANDAPTASDDTATVAEDTPVTVSVLANDTDVDNDTLTVSAVTQGTNGTVAIVGGSQVTYTPNANFHGTDSFTYTANDGNGGTDTATVNVTINPANDAPVADDDAASVVEDDSVAVAVLGNDGDVDGDSLTITAVTQGTNGAVAIAGSTVTYTPAPNFNGTDSFTYTISDGNGGTDTATVTMTITASNDALTAVDDAATVAEDGSVTVNVLANDTDPENDPLTVLSVTQGTNGAVAIVGNQVTYTPNADFNGSDSFTYTASDGNGGTGGATVTVTVTPVNDAPVAGDDTASVVEDGSVTISVLGDDTDVDGDTLVVASVTQGTNGTVVIVGSSQVTYTPAADFNGTDSFTYTVDDGNGGTDTANVTVTVGAANDAPVANGDSASTSEDTAVSVSVLANDTDLDGDTLSVASVTQGANGAVTIDGTQVVYTPGADFHGGDSFTYTASDGNGGSATATVTVTVTPVNDAPVAVADTATVAEDGSIPVSVLANDSDVDGDSLTLAAVTQGANGSVSISGSQAVYTPNANYNGPDSFTYTVSDGNGGSAVGAVTVTVTGTNDAPVAVNDSATVAEDGSISISVLGNDSDLDGDTLTITAVTQGTNGSVTHNGSTVTYTPNANYNGSDSFSYTISDGNGGSASASVAVTITPVNDAPVAVNDTATTLAEVAVTVNVRANDSDIDSPTLTVTAVTQGAHGSVAINAGATVTYTPAAGWVGPDSFTYTVSDGSGGTATATVDVTVQAPARVTGNLQVLYTFNEGSGTTVNDVSGVGTPLNLTISNASAVTWLPGALSLNTSVLVQSAGTATKVINACKSSNEVTVEAWVAPDNTTQTGPAVIASIAQNTTKRNVTLGQSGTAYNGQLKTSTTSQAGTQLDATGAATTSLTHVVYTRSSTGAVRIYVNGTQVASSTLTGNLSGWSNYALALGGEPNGARYWVGDMHLVAIYSRALTAAEARQNWLAGAN